MALNWIKNLILLLGGERRLDVFHTEKNHEVKLGIKKLLKEILEILDQLFENSI